MLPTIRPQVTSLFDMMSYTFFIVPEGARHLSRTGHSKMSTYATYVSYYSLYSRLWATQQLAMVSLLFNIVKVQDPHLQDPHLQEPHLTGKWQTYNNNLIPLFKIKLVVFVLKAWSRVLPFMFIKLGTSYPCIEEPNLDIINFPSCHMKVEAGVMNRFWTLYVCLVC